MYYLFILCITISIFSSDNPNQKEQTFNEASTSETLEEVITLHKEIQQLLAEREKKVKRIERLLTSREKDADKPVKRHTFEKSPACTIQ